jgi:tRNA (cytidine/uridine-2'-O-)-methyltransferase
MEIALYQPDIAPNTATILRMAACFGLTVRIIEPTGFHWSESSLRRAGMDYLEKAKVVRDTSWEAFRTATAGRRLVLLTTRASQPYTAFPFSPGDILLLGRESAGVPPAVHEAADARLLIPMRPGQCRLGLRDGDRGSAAPDRGFSYCVSLTSFSCAPMDSKAATRAAESAAT